MDKFKATNTAIYRDPTNGSELKVEVQNDENRFQWRLTVNGDVGPVSGHYAGIYEHKGYCLATNYWDGMFKEFVPFKAVYGKAA